MSNSSKQSERIARYIDELCLFDDRFMSIVFKQNYKASEYVLNVILNRNDLKVKEISTQVKLCGNSVNDKFVILDILAVDTSGKAYDIEIQRANETSLAKRARYYSAMLDTRLLKEGQDYSELKDSYVIFICEKDYLKANKVIYHIDRYIKEINNDLFNDGSHIIYVNGAYKDVSTALGQLVHDFSCTKTKDMYSDILRRHIGYYKDNNGGNTNMGDTFERFAEEIREENTKKVTRKVTKEVTKEVKSDSIRNIMDSLKLTAEQAMDALKITGEERNYYLAIFNVEH